MKWGGGAREEGKKGRRREEGRREGDREYICLRNTPTTLPTPPHPTPNCQRVLPGKGWA